MKKVVLSVLVISSIVGFICHFGPTIIAKKAEKALTTTLHTPVMVKGLSFNLKDQNLIINKVIIKNYPEFAEGNLFVLENVALKVRIQSLFSNLIEIKELGAESIQLEFTGGINQNNISHLKDILEKDDNKKVTKKTIHVKEKEVITKVESELKIKIDKIFFKQFSILLKVTSPIELPDKKYTFKNFTITNIGGKNGTSLNRISKITLEKMEMLVNKKLEKIAPHINAIINVNESLKKSKKALKDAIESEEVQEKLKEGEKELKNLFKKFKG